MILLSWNINGIRAVIKKGFIEWLKREKPDFLCVQEIKIAKEARVKELDHIFEKKLKDYEIFWNSAKRPGYSGTAVFVKKEIESLYLKNFKWDDEGRVQILELEKFFLINVYFPNANHELSRLDFKIKFNNKLLRYLKKLEKKKPIVICGDYNVAHEEIDLARSKENIGNPGFTVAERTWMTKFLQAGFSDVFRENHPKEKKYSWWSYRAQARKKNVGWRIDYFCVSKGFKNKIKRTFIDNSVMGSDHCPVGIEIK